MSTNWDFQTEPVRLVGVSKFFDEVVAVNHLDLVAEEGQITTLLGPSGCGKTTTLRMIAGFYIPDEGEIFIGDERITHLPPHRRPTRTVFQNYALFPHMTVFENIAFGLQLMKVPSSEQKKRVQEILQVVGLEGLGDRQPGQLSGGQQQRVSLARALVTRPKVLLLDEPLSNLDAKLRMDMRVEIRRLQEELGITTIYVTHDQEEALSLSNQIAVMNKGELLQFGPPAEIYERPVNRFVAQFLGLSNFLEGEIVEVQGDEARVRFGDYVERVAVAHVPQPGQRVVVTVRPENLLLVPDGPGIPGRIVSTSYLGAVARYHVHVPGQADEVIVDDHAPVGSRVHQPGDSVRLQLRPGRGFVQE